jgi:exosortase/archaeosortase family protein
MTAVPDTTGLNTLYGRNTRLGRGPARTVVSMAALTALAGVLFVAGQTVFRDWEALAVGEAARAAGFHTVLAIEGSQILLAPSSGPFWVDITPSCSSLGPALALALIATIMSVGSPTSDRLLAGVVGVAAIVVGNLLRIGSSVLVGLLAGRVSLVLFHDWVGSTFGFAYTIGGFVLILTILLRRRRRREAS